MTEEPSGSRPPMPTPVIQSDAIEYFKAAEQGILKINRCSSCGEAYFYPRQMCPFCSSLATEWIECSGRGTVYSFTILRRGINAPSAPAYVTLEEGPTVLTALADQQFENIEIGQRVKAVFRPVIPGMPPILMFVSEGV